MTKKLKRKTLLSEGLEKKFHKKIAEGIKEENSNMFNTEKYKKFFNFINKQKPDEKKEVLDKNKKSELELEKEENYFFEDNELTQQEKGVEQILIQKFSKSIKEAMKINKKLIDIHETIQTFSSHVYDQEQITGESILISTPKCFLIFKKHR